MEGRESERERQKGEEHKIMEGMEGNVRGRDRARRGTQDNGREGEEERGEEWVCCLLHLMRVTHQWPCFC